MNLENPYRQPILDLFLSCKDWPVIKKFLDSSSRRTFRGYKNIKGTPIKELYPYQIREYERLAATMADPHSRWARKYRKHQENLPTQSQYKQLELGVWEAKRQ